MKVDGRPYSQTGAGKSFIRKFSHLESPDEFKWHRDERKRMITVLSGNGWSFQFDNSIPFTLSVGQVFIISPDYWHRILPGIDELVLKIEED